MRVVFGGAGDRLPPRLAFGWAPTVDLPPVSLALGHGRWGPSRRGPLQGTGLAPCPGRASQTGPDPDATYRHCKHGSHH